MPFLGRQLRELVASGSTVQVPDVPTALVAKMAASEGFQAVYVGSFDISNVLFGVPDQSLLGISQLIDQAGLICSRVEVPVVLDLEDGGGNAVTTYHNVRLAEAAGVAAIQIEDHVPGKAYGRGGSLHPVGVASEKIRAAVEARTSDDTVIIGRTEAILLGLEEDEAFDRAAAYVEAGADMATVSLLPVSRARAVGGQLGVPLANFVIGESLEEVTAAGYGLAIYPGHAVVTEHQAMQRWLRDLRRNGVSHTLESFNQVGHAINELVGGPQNTRLAEQFGIIPPLGD